MQSSTRKKSGISVIRSVCMNEHGAVLVISLAFLVLLTMLGTTAVVITTTDMKIGSNYRDSERAFNDAQAAIQYVVGKMEEGLKIWSGGSPGFTLPTSTTAASPLISSFTVPTGFKFTYPSEITRVTLDTDPDDIFEFLTNGTTLQGSTVSITARVQRLPGIMFGVFGDNKLELKNTAGVYSYSYKDCLGPPVTCLPPTPADSTGEADVGSNTAVILNMGDIIDGSTAVGETLATGTDGSYTDHGATVNGSENVDMGWIDPDPLGIIGGDYATNLALYSNPANNDNGTAIEGDDYYTPPYVIGIGPTISLDGKDTLTLKGTATGANFYFTDIELKSNSILFIDTTLGKVNIYLTGAMDVINGAELVHLRKPSTGGCDGPSGSCECATPGPPSFDCAPCFLGSYEIGAPSDFSIFSNSTDRISIGNSVDFSGLIYAPFAQVRFDNAVTVYGSIWGYDVELVTNTIVYFDTDMKDKFESSDLKIISWRDHRM